MPRGAMWLCCSPRDKRPANTRSEGMLRQRAPPLSPRTAGPEPPGRAPPRSRLVLRTLQSAHRALKHYRSFKPDHSRSRHSAAAPPPVPCRSRPPPCAPAPGTAIPRSRPRHPPHTGTAPPAAGCCRHTDRGTHSIHPPAHRPGHTQHPSSGTPSRHTASILPHIIPALRILGIHPNHAILWLIIPALHPLGIYPKHAIPRHTVP
ncbi:PREDICTED: classical arabinogalactan protein 9-like [Ficedula albicollis]|uniref:classical arabinogalactan protein 9-like n=1 Tax=Ficedula albicollis TaxID=59894 RepID=UPI0007AD787D|nr:PREDICTED: classical arabinogalactan protein 9-like [Ficedula albicollis]